LFQRGNENSMWESAIEEYNNVIAEKYNA